jgi:hypothetical protein
MSDELTTRELVIVSMYQNGYSPTTIAMKLAMNPGDVRTFLKSPKAVAHLLEQEETTDKLIETLYRDGAEALRRALASDNPNTALRAAELTFRVLGKMKSDTKEGDQTSIHVEKLLQVIGAPISAQELAGVSKYFPTNVIEGEVYGDN